MFAPRGLASESLSFYGFDPAKMSPASQEGLEAIFSGKCFHNGTPLAQVRMMVKVMSQQNKFGYSPASVEGRFYAFGRLPSPADRTAGMEEGMSLGSDRSRRPKRLEP